MIIKLWDNECYEYPLIEIKDNFSEKFERDLKQFKENEDYNLDDFIVFLGNKDYFIQTIYIDKEVFF